MIFSISAIFVLAIELFHTDIYSQEGVVWFERETLYIWRVRFGLELCSMENSAWIGAYKSSRTHIPVSTQKNTFESFTFTVFRFYTSSDRSAVITHQ